MTSLRNGVLYTQTHQNTDTQMAHTYEYPRAAVTVDCVVFGVDLDDQKAPLKILLIKRKDDPFKDCLALPGGYVDVGDEVGKQGESLEAAAYRELEEETGIKVAYLEQLCTFGDPDRDPRGRVVSVAHFALVRTAEYEPKAGDDAAEAMWVSLAEVLESPHDIAFDHAKILSVALSRLQAKIQYTPIGFSLLPKEFSLGQLQSLYEAVLGRELEKRNFRKRILATGILSAAGTDSSAYSSSRPGPKAKLYRFNERAYKTIKNFTFEV